MAKTESTAVNALIANVQRGTVLPEPSADLFAGANPKQQTPSRGARVTSAAPPTSAAGEIAPLPRTRAPAATAEQLLPPISSPHAPAVRMTGPQESRGTTIPPLPPLRRTAASTATPPITTSSAGITVPSTESRAARMTTSSAGITVPSTDPRATRPSLPPPRSARATTSSPAVPLPRASSAAPTAAPSRMPAGTLPPPTAPVAAPFNLEIDVAPAQVARSTSPKLPELPKPALLIDLPSPQLFNQDETWVGTLPAPAKKTGLAKLAIPTIALATVGGVVAAIVMFGGKDTRPAKPSPSLAQPAAPSAPAAPAEETILRPSPRAIESANAATASAGGEQPEPPTKAEQAAEIASASLTHDVPSDQREPIAGANAALAESARPATREVRTPNGVVTYADIRIDSDPAGATVTLVDRGKQSFLGSTPLSTSIDTSREYDLIVALDGRPTQMVHVDPSKTSRVDVSLGRTVPRGGVALAVTAESVEETKAPAAKAKVVDDTALESTKADAVVSPKAAKVAKVEVPKAEAKATKTETKAEPKAVKTDKAETTETKPAPKAAKTDKAETAETKAAPVATSGTGTLMVSSKPPCEILIDGKATGLTTPQRAIELPAGAHKITFVNEAAGIKKTVSVKITPDQSTKLIQDLMK